MDSNRTEVAQFTKGRVPREVRRQQLLDLAEPLLVEHGYEGFSIEELCQAAGVSRPVVYEHFGSKEGIFLAVQSHSREEFARELSAAGSAAHDLESAVRAGSLAYFTILERDPQRWLMVFGSTTGYSGPLADDLWELRSQTVDGIADLVRDFDDTLSPRQLAAIAHSVSGAGEGLGRWWMRNLDIPRKWVVGQHVQLTLAAIEAARTEEGTS